MSVFSSTMYMPPGDTVPENFMDNDYVPPCDLEESRMMHEVPVSWYQPDQGPAPQPALLSPNYFDIEGINNFDFLGGLINKDMPVFTETLEHTLDNTATGVTSDSGLQGSEISVEFGQHLQKEHDYASQPIMYHQEHQQIPQSSENDASDEDEEVDIMSVGDQDEQEYFLTPSPSSSDDDAYLSYSSDFSEKENTKPAVRQTSWLRQKRPTFVALRKATRNRKSPKVQAPAPETSKKSKTRSAANRKPKQGKPKSDKNSEKDDNTEKERRGQKRKPEEPLNKDAKRRHHNRLEQQRRKEMTEAFRRVGQALAETGEAVEAGSFPKPSKDDAGEKISRRVILGNTLFVFNKTVEFAQKMKKKVAGLMQTIRNLTAAGERKDKKIQELDAAVEEKDKIIREQADTIIQQQIEMADMRRRLASSPHY